MDEKVKEIYDKHQKGEELSKEEYTSLLKYFSKASEDESGVKIEKDFGSVDDFNNAFTALVQAYAPQYKEEMLEMQKKGEISDNLEGIVNAALRIRDIGESREQIAKSEEAKDEIRKPSLPKIAPTNRDLARNIEMARIMEGDTSRETEPLRRSILDAYRAELGAARTASAGQASTYGALAQSAANRRLKGELNRARVAAQIGAQNRNRLDRLVQDKMADDERIYNQGLGQFDRKYRDYLTESKAVADLGAQGRENLRSSLYNTRTMIPYTAEQLSNINLNKQEEVDIGMANPSEPTGLGEYVDNYNQIVDNSLRASRYSAPSMRKGAYDGPSYTGARARYADPYGRYMDYDDPYGFTI